jgi:hypothetical protein
MTPHERLAKYVKEYYDWCYQERQNLLEDTWNFCYDAFKGEYSSANIARWKKLEGHDWRSKFFVRLTKQKIVAVVSQIEDVEFQGGKLPWDLTPTEIPEQSAGFRMDPKAAEFRCRMMKKQLDDNLTETDAEKHFVSSLLEMALYGMSWLRAPAIRQVTCATVGVDSPIPGMFLPPELMAQYGQYGMQFQTKSIPTVEHLNLWDMFWDLESAGHQEGKGIVHRVMMSVGELLRLGDRPGYDKESVNRVAQAALGAMRGGGGADPSEGPYQAKLQLKRNVIPVLEFYGRVPRNCIDDNLVDTSSIRGLREVECSCKVSIFDRSSTLARGPFVGDSLMAVRPLHLAKWEESPFETGGTGVAENLRDTQAMLNSAVRCFIDNKAFSSQLLFFGKSNALAPGQNRNIYSGKFFELANHVMDWREAMGFAQTPDVGNGILDLINMIERFADEDTNAPRLLQGERSRSSPKTAFESSQLLQAATKALGKVIRNRERGHYETSIKTLYWWEMLTNQNQLLKGDFTPKATGYSSYMNKMKRGQTLSTLLTMALTSPLLSAMIDPHMHVYEIYKAADLDPDLFLKTPEQIQQEAEAMMARMQPPPGAPGMGVLGQVSPEMAMQGDIPPGAPGNGGMPA